MWHWDRFFKLEWEECAHSVSGAPIREEEQIRGFGRKQVVVSSKRVLNFESLW
jgi:hypothetical protein